MKALTSDLAIGTKVRDLHSGLPGVVVHPRALKGLVPAGSVCIMWTAELRFEVVKDLGILEVVETSGKGRTHNAPEGRYHG